MINLDEVLLNHEKWLNNSEEDYRANLRGADLLGANLGGANLRHADLLGADLRYSNLGGAKLVGADLRRAKLVGADLGDANLGGADLRYANLGGANLGGADLRNANLRNADLRGANLGDANLCDVVGNMNEIKSLFVGTYSITYTSEVMQIGCERHAISEWFNFDDTKILQMDGRQALTFWRKWKPILQSIIEE